MGEFGGLCFARHVRAVADADRSHPEVLDEDEDDERKR